MSRLDPFMTALPFQEYRRAESVIEASELYARGRMTREEWLAAIQTSLA